MRPVWLRWGLPFGIAILLMAGLIVFVDAHNNDSLAVLSPQQQARQEREAAIVTAQDQAPRVVAARLRGGPRRAMLRAVTAEMTQLINNGTIAGSLQRTTCRAAGRRGTTSGFSCTAVAEGQGYRFLGVVDAATRQITICKHDEPPIPGMDIPVSARCRA